MLRLASVALTAVCALAFVSSAVASGVRVLTPAEVPHRATPVEQRAHPVLPHDPAALRAGKAAAQQAPLRSPLAELASPQAGPSAPKRARGTARPATTHPQPTGNPHPNGEPPQALGWPPCKPPHTRTTPTPEAAANAAVLGPVTDPNFSSRMQAYGRAKMAQFEQRRKVDTLKALIRSVSAADGKKMLLLVAHRLSSVAGAEFLYAAGQTPSEVRAYNELHADADLKSWRRCPGAR